MVEMENTWRYLQPFKKYRKFMRPAKRLAEINDVSKLMTVRFALSGNTPTHHFYYLRWLCFSLKIMICGSIGYGGVDDIKNLYSFLHSNGFSTVNHVVQKGMDYSDINDFRDKRDLSHQIVNYDLQYIMEADILVVIANSPSYGTGMEMFMARNSGKKVILLAKDPVPTPWPINFSDYIIKNEIELISLLQQLQNEAS